MLNYSDRAMRSSGTGHAAAARLAPPFDLYRATCPRTGCGLGVTLLRALDAHGAAMAYGCCPAGHELRISVDAETGEARP